MPDESSTATASSGPTGNSPTLLERLRARLPSPTPSATLSVTPATVYPTSGSALVERIRRAAEQLGLDIPPPPEPAPRAPPALPPPRTANAGGFAVRASPELDRILAIARRTASVSAAETASLHEELCLPNGTRRLRPIQALALAEARRANGLFAPIGVGQGKSDIALLLPVVMRSKVAVLLVPANLREKVFQQDYPTLVTEYRVPRLANAKVQQVDSPCVLHVLSYNELSSANQHDVLERLQPDLVICDEAHALRHPSAARTRRFLNYFRSHRDTRLCVLSGTMTSKSIKDYAHLAWLSLRENAPVPTKWSVLEEWAAALDSSPVPAPPGALVTLCEPGEKVREGFRRRVVDTPGVVATAENELGVGLVISERELRAPPVIREALKTMRETWTTPDEGEAFDDILTLHRYCRQLAAGFYYRWVWPANEPATVRRTWLDARSAWHREVANFLTYRAKPGIDSPLLLAKACADGRVSSMNYARWVEVKDTARPEVEAVWLNEYLVDDAVAWGQENVGIVWYEHASLGAAISRKGGFPLFGPNADGILKEKGKRTIVASIRAHGTGKNLQVFDRNLVTTAPTSGTVWEQLLGRTHRPGQKADEVTVEVYRHTLEMRSAMNKALRDADYQQTTTGNRQKLLSATYTFRGENG